jgi:hypothetical protein
MTQRAARNSFLEKDVKTNLRRATYKAARLASYQPFADKPADFLWFHPSPRDAQELADLSARINWYIPGCRVPLYAEAAASRPIAVSDAPYMDPALVRDPGWASSKPAGRPEHVYWKMTPALGPHFLAHARHAEIADATWFWVSDRGWTRLTSRYALVPSPSSKALENLMALRVNDGTAFVLGTGPSATAVDFNEVHADVRIICNSAVRNDDLLGRFRPQVLCFADPVFHFGPSRYAATFRADMLKAVEKHDLHVVTSSYYAMLLLANHPEIVDRTTVLDVDPRSPYTCLSMTSSTVRRTLNILTQAMLPVAGSLASTIKIAGCDGRNPDEDYFWQHNRQVQYADDMMQSAFSTHPAFFRDVAYGGHYTMHCQQLEELCQYLESQGCKIEPVTPSWIPALRKRGAPRFSDEQTKSAA